MCTSSAFWLPSDCGMAALPRYEPSLMSACVAFTTATTVTLSVSVILCAAPSFVLTDRTLPSSASMVPRRRSGGCCAHADKVHSDRIATRARRVTTSIELLPKSRARPRGRARPLCGVCVHSHRRRETAADIDGGRLQRAVRLLVGAEDDDGGARLEFTLVARRIGDDRDVLRNDDLLLVGLVARLVLDGDNPAFDASGDRLHGGIGHGGAGPQIPWAVTFAGPALRLAEDMDGDRLLAAVGLRIGGHPDIGVGLDILDRRLDEAHHAHVFRGCHRDLVALARLDDRRVAVDLLDGAADADRRRALRPYGRRAGDQGDREGAGGEPDNVTLHGFPP